MVSELKLGSVEFGRIWQVMCSSAVILEAETKTVINSIIVIGIKTPLNIASIALQDKRESVYNKLNK